MTSGGDDAIRAARERRVVLRETMIALEAAMTAPSGLDGWLDAVRDRLDDLSNALGNHIAEVDRADGIIAKALDQAPWLESHAEILRNQHGELTALVERLGAHLSALDVDDPRAVAIAREEGYDLLRLLSRHRQNGAELVYDAYDMDIGGLG